MLNKIKKEKYVVTTYLLLFLWSLNQHKPQKLHQATQFWVLSMSLLIFTAVFFHGGARPGQASPPRLNVSSQTH